MEQIIFATKNKGKIKEVKSILHEFEIISMEEACVAVEVIEDGKTFTENAIKKATEISKITGKITMADDSGLEIDFLDKKPGVYSARYAGEPSNSDINNKKLLKEMQGKSNRNANFTSVIAICYPNGKIITANGKTYGKILTELQGENGFGYDPLFYSNDLKKSFGLATSEEKNAVSHRGRALQNLKEILSKRK